MVENYNEILHKNETLHTPRLLLRKFKEEDAADIFEYARDSKTAEFMTWEAHQSIDVSEWVLFNCYMAHPGFFAIELEQKCIGCIEIRLHPEDEKASFGFVLNRAYWGRGLMTEALSALLKLAFEELELNRVESTHYVGNEGSGKVMAKCGMKLEGIGIREKKIKGIFRDVVHYAILRACVT